MKVIQKLGFSLLPLVILFTALLLPLLPSPTVNAADGGIESPAITITLTGSPPANARVTATPRGTTAPGFDEPVHNIPSYRLTPAGATNQYVRSVLDFHPDVDCRSVEGPEWEAALTFDIAVNGETVGQVQSFDTSGENCNQMSASFNVSGGTGQGLGTLTGTFICVDSDGNETPGRISENQDLILSIGSREVRRLTSSDSSADGSFTMNGLQAGSYTLAGSYVGTGDVGNDCVRRINNAPVTIRAGETTRFDLSSEVSGDPDTGVAAGEGEQEDNTCEGKSGAMGWILCPFIDLLDGGLNWVDWQIQRLLEIDEDKYANEDLRSAWVVIRNIAYIVLIPIMLVMVLGTALGFEIFSAYTVKKALPRMVVAVIFITFSWYICGFMIDFFNTLGGGILGIVTAPFTAQMPEACQTGGLNLACLFEVQNGANGSNILRGIASPLLLTGSALGLIVMIIALAGPLFVGAAVAFLVLILRQMFIIALIFLAPLAILAWIFPGNDKLWKNWWSVFSKLLMMFPLIMLIIAVGRVFAWLINETDGGGLDGAVLNPIAKLIAYMLPYALIPLTFKFAGGIFANLAGVVNDRGKGIGDRYRQLRNAGLKKFHENAMNEQGRFGVDGTKLGKVGSMYRRGAALGRHGSLGLTKNSRARWKDYKMKHLEEIADKKNEEGGNRSFADDDASKIARSGVSRDQFITEYAKVLKKQQADGRDDLQGLDEEDLKDLARMALARTEQGVGARMGSAAMRISAAKYRAALTNTAYDPGEEGLTELQDELKDLQRDGLITAVDGAIWMKSNRGRFEFSAAPFSETIAFAGGHRTAKQQMISADAGAEVREKLGGHQRSVETFAEMGRMHEERVSKNNAALQAALESGATKVRILDRNFVETEVDVNDKTIQWVQQDTDITTADMSNVYSQLSSTSARKAQVWAEGKEGKAGKPGIPGALSMEVTYRVKEPEFKDVEVDVKVPDLEPDGTPVMRLDPSSGKMEQIFRIEKRTEKRATGGWTWVFKKGTGRTLIEDTRDRKVAPDGSDGWYFDRVKEWGSMTEAEAAERAARGEAARRAEEEAAGGPKTSDRRLKKDIVRLKVLDSGIVLYSFRYIWGNQVYVGVMAQDLIDTRPEAITIGSDGFYLVDYSLLGIRMQTIEDWETEQTKAKTLVS